MSHNAEKEVKLSLMLTESPAGQQPESASPNQASTPTPAQRQFTAQAKGNGSSDTKTRNMKLPLELWREVIREAGAIQDEFECPTLVHDMAGESPNKLYLVLWHKALQTRLSLALVSRSWHSIALQYLYASIVVKRDNQRTFMHMVARLAEANLARWVQRVTLLGFIPETTGLQRTLEYLPNLRIFDTGANYYPIFNLASMCRHLLSLENIGLCAEMVRALSELPNLQYLRCRIDLFINVDRPVVFPQLHTLHLVTYSIQPWTQYLIMPKLRTLRLDDRYLPSSALQDIFETILPTIHALASDNQLALTNFLAFPPTVPFPAPRLRELLIKDHISTLIHIPCHISLANLEVIHLPLERELLQGIVPNDQFEVSVQWEQRVMTTLSMAFWVTRHPSITPRLHTVCTDVTSNTLTLAGPLIREYLEAWLEGLEARGVQVFTRVYETIWSDAKQISLARVLNSAPNFEFWPPCLSPHEDVDRWERLAYATGRHMMKWNVKSHGIECEWLAP
jgi:hypothetical protein